MTRRYLPVGFEEPEVIANGSALIVADATRYHFGVLSSAMHTAWMRYTCGRMKSDYQYSSQIVYNNYPWPERPTAQQRAAVETAAQRVLSVRAEFLGFGVPPSGGPVAAKSARKPPKGGTPNATLADLYDPLGMPPALVKGYADLDGAVGLCYRPQPFESERHRVEFLFALYEKLTAPLLPATKPKRGKKAALP